MSDYTITKLTLAVVSCICLDYIKALTFYGLAFSKYKQRSVITRRSVEYMPFLLSFFLFLNGGIWTLYAILDKDIFIGVCSYLLCLIILSLYRFSYYKLILVVQVYIEDVCNASNPHEWK